MWGNGDDGLYKAPTMEEEKSERLRGEGDKIKFIDLRFERLFIARLRNLFPLDELFLSYARCSFAGRVNSLLNLQSFSR